MDRKTPLVLVQLCRHDNRDISNHRKEKSPKGSGRSLRFNGASDIYMYTITHTHIHKWLIFTNESTYDSRLWDYRINIPMDNRRLRFLQSGIHAILQLPAIHKTLFEWGEGLYLSIKDRWRMSWSRNSYKIMSKSLPEFYTDHNTT